LRWRRSRAIRSTGWNGLAIASQAPSSSSRARRLSCEAVRRRTVRRRVGARAAACRRGRLEVAEHHVDRLAEQQLSRAAVGRPSTRRTGPIPRSRRDLGAMGPNRRSGGWSPKPAPAFRYPTSSARSGAAWPFRRSRDAGCRKWTQAHPEWRRGATPARSRTAERVCLPSAQDSSFVLVRQDAAACAVALFDPPRAAGSGLEIAACATHRFRPPASAHASASPSSLSRSADRDDAA
jgi:hypothetical protein